MSRRVDKNPKIHYPPGCKELSEELSNDELVKRLKMLARVFQDLGQEENTVGDYKQLALYLVTEFFLDHPNKDVRLLIACCIADVFRVFAPEAPYTEPDQLKEIFMFLTNQFKGLEDPECPSFKRNFYLLENLAWVKSFNICLELEDNQEIFISLFKVMFGIVNEKHQSKVTGFMLDMMCPLITEADSVSQELLDVILVFIIEPLKTQRRPAYNLARELIKRTATFIEPYIQTFFNGVLMMGKASDSGLAGRLYDLVQELNVIAPSVLTAVLPQLELKLKSSEESDRVAATRMLSKMFSEEGSDLADVHKSLWACFLGRFNDIDVSVRRLCVQASQEFIVNHPELVKDDMTGHNITEHLRQRQHDSDETVRIEVVQAIIGAAKRKFSNVTTELFECVKERTLDKKFKIRKEALLGLGQIYRRSYEGEGELDSIPWVRNKILHAYYQASVDDKVLVERILNVSLVPYSLEPAERMRRLYILYGNLDDHASRALQEIFKMQCGLRILVRGLIELVVRADVDDSNVALTGKLLQLSRHLPPGPKTMESLKRLGQMLRQDQRMRGSLAKLVAPDCTCKKAEEFVKDILKKIGNPAPTNLIYTTTKLLLERIAPVMIDTSAILALTKYIDQAVLAKVNDEECEIALLVPNCVEMGVKLLLLLSHAYSGCFQQEDVYRQLMVFVRYDDDSVSDVTMQIFKNVGQNLETSHPEIHKSLLPALEKMIKIGTAKQAKHAIRCIDAMYSKTKDAIFKRLYEHLEKNMDVEASNFLTSLVALGHISLLCPTLFATSTGNIVSKFIVKELLMQDRTVGRKSSDTWCAEHLVSEETQAKIQGLKMIVRWLLGVRSSNPSTVSPTLRLLYSMILCEGDLMEHGTINKAEMARLRLQAGCCMLKLAQEPLYADAIRLEQFETMALLVNDPCVEVRQMFVQKLHKGLIALRLPLQYMSVLCLGALDPIKERRGLVKQMLCTNIQRRRDFLKQNAVTNPSKILSLMPDYVMPYAIHLMAHDPDLATYDDVKALKSIKECLWYLLEPLIAKNEGYSFAFYKKLFETIKQTKDAQNPESEESNKKLYAVCDLSLSLILTKVTNISYKDFPAEPVLPAKLFTQADLTYPNTITYLPAELLGGASVILPSKPTPGTAVKKDSGMTAAGKTQTGDTRRSSSADKSITGTSGSTSAGRAKLDTSGSSVDPVSPGSASNKSTTSPQHAGSTSTTVRQSGGKKSVTAQEDKAPANRSSRSKRSAEESDEESQHSDVLSEDSRSSKRATVQKPGGAAAAKSKTAAAAGQRATKTADSTAPPAKRSRISAKDESTSKITDFMKPKSRRGTSTTDAESDAKPDTDEEEEDEENEEQEEERESRGGRKTRVSSLSSVGSPASSQNSGKQKASAKNKKPDNARPQSKTEDKSKASTAATKSSTAKRSADKSASSLSVSSSSSASSKTDRGINGSTVGARTGRKTDVSRRREGAAAKAAQRYADFEVAQSPVKKKKT